MQPDEGQTRVLQALQQLWRDLNLLSLPKTGQQTCDFFNRLLCLRGVCQIMTNRVCSAVSLQDLQSGLVEFPAPIAGPLSFHLSNERGSGEHVLSILAGLRGRNNSACS